MAPDELAVIRERRYYLLYEAKCDRDELVAYIDELHATIAALRAGQGTPQDQPRKWAVTLDQGMYLVSNGDFALGTVYSTQELAQRQADKLNTQENR